MLKISVKITPGARTSKIILEDSNRLHIYVTSQPENGKANKAIIELLSKLLKLPKSDIDIISGLTSRYKLISINKLLTLEELLAKLNLAIQKDIFKR